MAEFKHDLTVMAALIWLAGKKPTFGYQRLTDERRPNQVWVCDITYNNLSTDEIVYLAIVMDHAEFAPSADWCTQPNRSGSREPSLLASVFNY